MLKKWQKKMIGSSKREVNEAFGRKMNDDPQWEWKIVLGGNEQGYKHRTVCANVKDSTGGVLVNNDERKGGENILLKCTMWVDEKKQMGKWLALKM